MLCRVVRGHSGSIATWLRGGLPGSIGGDGGTVALACWSRVRVMGQQDIVMAPVVCPSLSRADVSSIMHLAGSVGGGAHLIAGLGQSRRERRARMVKVK